MLSQAQRAILREEDNLIKKWLKAIRTILSQAQRAISVTNNPNNSYDIWDLV